MSICTLSFECLHKSKKKNEKANLQLQIASLNEQATAYAKREKQLLQSKNEVRVCDATVEMLWVVGEVGK